MRPHRVYALLLLAIVLAYGAPGRAAPDADPDDESGHQVAQVGISRSVLNAVDEGEAASDADAGILNRFRQSSVLMRTMARVVAFDRSAELTWNPTVSEYVDISPRYWLTKESSIGIGVNFQHEFTQDDSTTYRNETLWGDFRAGYSIASVAHIPGIDVDISASFGLTLPLSKWSQAAGLIATVTPGIQFSRTFEDILGGLTIGYSVSFTKLFHRYTTAVNESPHILGCVPGGDTNCDSFTNTGSRNSSYRLGHGLSISLSLAPWCSVSTDVLAYVSWLYGSVEDDRISLTPQTPTNTRHALYVDLGATFIPWPPMSLRIGLNTFAPQLAPDSSRYTPGLNTFTNLYFDIRFDVAGVIRALR